MGGVDSMWGVKTSKMDDDTSQAPVAVAIKSDEKT
jgi:hypothetical protein